VLLSLKPRALLGGLLVVSACRGFPEAPTYPGDDPAFAPPAPVDLPGMPDAPPAPYALLPGDVVRLRVVSADPLDLPGLVIDSSGRLHVPSGGDVVVGGAGLGEAEERIRRALEPVDRFARVILSVDSPAGHRATVIGQVQKPGTYDLKAGARVTELLALAGGPRTVDAEGEANELGDLEDARVVREGVALPVRVDLAMEGDPRHDVRVAPGDIVYVPPARGRRVAVLGEVRTPRVVPFHRGLRLTEALAMAGGSTQDADNADVRVVRGPLSRPRVYRADLKALVGGSGGDVELAPGDVVFVTEHWYATLTNVINRLVPSLAAVTFTTTALRQ
jgi:polysaccharide export outer membrane protein